MWEPKGSPPTGSGISVELFFGYYQTQPTLSFDLGLSTIIKDARLCPYGLGMKFLFLIDIDDASLM
jgi:hypothetical protein